MRDKNLILGISIVIAGALVSLAILYSDFGLKEVSSKQNLVGISKTEIENIKEVSYGEDNTIGNKDAPVKMIEYSDYTCPFCAKYWKESLPIIKEKYVDTGKVFYEFRDFPIIGGIKASHAANCALEQDLFWEYHNILFSRQNSDRRFWNENEIYREYAEALEMDGDSLIECIEEEKYIDKINMTNAEAQSLGAIGTPFFIINGKPLSGAFPYNSFELFIEEELKNLGIE